MAALSINTATMIDYHYLLKNPRLFRAFVGIDLKIFKELLKGFETELEMYLSKYTKEGHKRRRALGGGMKSDKFDKPSKLMALTLFYIRAYPTYDLLQIFYQIDKSALHRHIQLGLRILEKAVGHKIPLPARRTSTLEELFIVIPELREHIVDASEQPVNRPKKNQKLYYSGKKKRHTIKRQFVVTPDRKIISVSYAVEGKKHDKTLAEESSYLVHAPPDSTGLADLGYQGIDTEGLSVKIGMPIKKKAGKDLTQDEKATNRSLSSIRVIGEHVIGHLKFNRIYSDKIRYRLPVHDQISNIVAGIHNLKLEM